MSSIQALSDNVILRIYSYVNEYSYKSRYHMKTMNAFLYVCSSWRRVAQTVMCETFESSQESFCGFYIWNDKQMNDYEAMPDCFPLFRLVKNVNVYAIQEDVLDGKMFAIERPEMIKKLVFPEATSLHLEFRNEDFFRRNDRVVSESSSDLEDEMDSTPKPKQVNDVFYQNLNNFVACLRGMVPNVNNVSIYLLSYDSSGPARLTDVADPILNLFGNNTQNSLYVSHRYYNLDMPHPLVHFEGNLYENDSDNNASDLIIRNAATLETVTLCADYPTTFDIWKFFGVRRGIMYPNMKKLCIARNYTVSPHLCEFVEITDDCVPFPNLESISLPGEYITHDDIIFRGNENALQSLCLYIEPKEVSMLVSTLAKTKREYLRYIRLNIDSMEYTHGTINNEINDMYASISSMFSSLPTSKASVDITETSLTTMVKRLIGCEKAIIEITCDKAISEITVHN